jgi:Ca2+-binding RTX toxin-like protein
VFAGTNNKIYGAEGSDRFYVGTGGGDNLLKGGKGADQFWIVTDEADLPDEANIIADFSRREKDVIGFANMSFTYADLGTDWNLRQAGKNTIIEVLNQDVSILQGVKASSLTESNFVFG